MITREQLVERLTLLRREREQVQGNLVQLQANLNAYDGAIQDCEYWLKVVDEEGGYDEHPDQR